MIWHRESIWHGWSVLYWFKFILCVNILTRVIFESIFKKCFYVTSFICYWLLLLIHNFSRQSVIIPYLLPPISIAIAPLYLMLLVCLYIYYQWDRGKMIVFVLPLVLLGERGRSEWYIWNWSPHHLTIDCSTVDLFLSGRRDNLPISKDYTILMS